MRQCGTCTLCCHALGIYELDKPPGKWCQDCAVGLGCRIYNDRPESCRAFACGWLLGLGPDEHRPDKVRGFISQPLSNMEIKDGRLAGVLVFTEASPDSWRRPQNEELIAGLLAMRYWVVVQHLDGRRTAIYSDGSTEPLTARDSWPMEVERWRRGENPSPGLLRLSGPAPP